MAIKIEETTLKNVLLIKPDIHEDFRGEYVETYNEEEYTKKINEKIGKEIKFVCDDFSTSTKHVLRGIHGDDKTWKLIDCFVGKIYVVIVNCDRESPDFGKWEAFNLSEKNRCQLLIPPKYGTSHLVLSEWAMFHYKQSAYYNPEVLKQFTYKFNDPQFKIWWPVKSPILSKRDSLE